MSVASAGATIRAMTLVGVIGWPQETNCELVAAWRARGIPAKLLSPPAAARVLKVGDVAVGRIDVLPTLDGPEPGFEVLGELALRGVRVLNGGEALLRAHDKLRTRDWLRAANVPHPRTIHLQPDEELTLEPPFVVKPRFGSWGADVFRCRTRAEVDEVLAETAGRPWFRRHGALVQELLPVVGHDLRLVIADGRVVGAVRRIASAGEWRTNVSLGGTREPAEPPREACRLGIAAAAAIGADLVGVDLFPVAGGYVVLELNGSVEFDEVYDLRGGDVYLDAAQALDLVPAKAAA
jgi:RimK family alpha-L-glutamate ligase